MSIRNNGPDIGGHGSETIHEETRRIRRVQRAMDLVLQLLAHTELSRGEALRLMEGMRRYALDIFPDKGAVFDLIYAPRLMRIYRSRFEDPIPVPRPDEP